MDAHILVPLTAAVAYIPLFAILLSDRPWQRRHTLFLLFLVPASLWSLFTFLGMSGLLGDQLVAVRIVLCIAILMLVQFHYFVSSFYQAERPKVPLAYMFVIATIALAVAGLIPKSVAPIDYGPWILAVGIGFLCTVGVKDVYSLIQRRNLSPDPSERNQIMYLLIAIAIFVASFFGAPSGGEFPVSHIGNLVIACILTYAVVTHRLVDINVVFRQALVYAVLYGSGIGILLLIFWLTHQAAPEFERYFPSVAVAIGLGIPAILFFAHKVRELWQRKVEDTFMGVRSFHRRKLANFIAEVHGVASLDDLCNHLMPLLAQSIDCRRACLLLPDKDGGGFEGRYTYPPADGNPARELKLRGDSPIVTWLERRKTILPERSLAILPEFQAIWEGEREQIKMAEVTMFVPLIAEERIVAIVAVSDRRDGKPLSVEDIDLLESVSRQVAPAMQRQYVRERQKELSEEAALVSHLTSIMTSSVSIEAIFEQFAQELKKVADVDWATIALVEGEELRVTVLSSTVDSAWQAGQRIPLEGTATEFVCRQRQAVYEPDLKRQHRFWTWQNHLERGIRCVLYLPLTMTDRPIGSLVIGSRKPNAYTDRQIRLLEKLASQIAAPIENAQLYARLEEKSRVDELTTLFNRRYFGERLKEELSRHSRYGEVFSIFMIDLDRFKAYNDVYGHPAGDVLLGQIGKIIKSCIRSVDLAFRYGGDEFVVILPQTAKQAAHVAAERIRSQLAREMEKRAIPLTCSIGVASYPEDAILSGELVDLADTALYHAKRTGGNRVLLSSKALLKPPHDGQAAGIINKPTTLSEIYDIASAVEAKDPYTYGHSKKVNTYAMALAERIGLSPDEVSALSSAALMHDIGKIGISERILSKKGKLTKEDWDAIKAHPRLGADIISNVPALAPSISSILYHHERWDGTGYPEGLKGEEIPLEARILAIADSFEAMTSARPYRPALSIEEVITELRQGAGSQFDPRLVQVFIEIVEEGLPGQAKVSQQAASEQSST